MRHLPFGRLYFHATTHAARLLEGGRAKDAESLRCANPEAQVEQLVDYLVKNYGDEKPRGLPPAPGSVK